MREMTLAQEAEGYELAHHFMMQAALPEHRGISVFKGEGKDIFTPLQNLSQWLEAKGLPTILAIDQTQLMLSGPDWYPRPTDTFSLWEALVQNVAEAA